MSTVCSEAAKQSFTLKRSLQSSCPSTNGSCSTLPSSAGHFPKHKYKKPLLHLVCNVSLWLSRVEDGDLDNVAREGILDSEMMLIFHKKVFLIKSLKNNKI